MFDQYETVAQKKGYVNLCYGVPEFAPPEFVTKSITDALNTCSPIDLHQYGSIEGPAGLRTEVVNTYGHLMNRDVNPSTEVFVSLGATACYEIAARVLLRPGDQAIILEPCYSLWIPQITDRGATVRFIDILEGFDKQTFEAAFNEKTRVFVFNSPHNPTGKVFTQEEQQYIADFIIQKYPEVVVIQDNAYCEHLLEGLEHHCIASLPGMWQRTVSIFSFGKTFPVTGWRVGYAIGPKEIIKAMVSIQISGSVCTPMPLNLAAEITLRESRKPFMGFGSYFEFLRNDHPKKFARFTEVLTGCGLKMKPKSIEGGFFIPTSIEQSVEELPIKYFYKDYQTNDHENLKLAKFEDWMDLKDPDYSPDYAFNNYLLDAFKIVAFPMSFFMSTMFDEPKKRKGTKYLRIPISRSFEFAEILRQALPKSSD